MLAGFFDTSFFMGFFGFFTGNFFSSSTLAFIAVLAFMAVFITNLPGFGNDFLCSPSCKVVASLDPVFVLALPMLPKC